MKKYSESAIEKILREDKSPYKPYVTFENGRMVVGAQDKSKSRSGVKFNRLWRLVVRLGRK